MDGGNSSNINEETPYAGVDDISEADPGASLNKVDEEDHVPVDDIFKMDAVRAELPSNLEKSKHVDQGGSSKKRARNVKETARIIRTSNGFISFNVKTDLRKRLEAARISKKQELRRRNELWQPAALVIASVPSPSADA